MLATQSPFVQYFDTDGSPLDGGFVYFGVANQNPETSPVAVYWDAAGTQPAAQPIRTVNGYTVRSGSPATIYTAGNYSLTTRNARGAVVVSVANSAATGNDQALQDQIAALAADLANETDLAKGAALVGYKGRTVADRLSERESVFDHMTDAQRADVEAGAFALDVSAAFQAAVAALPATGGVVEVPSAPGYRIDTTVTDGGKPVQFAVGACVIQCPQTGWGFDLKVNGSSFRGAGRSATILRLRSPSSAPVMPTATATISAGAVNGVTINTAGSNLWTTPVCLVSGSPTQDDAGFEPNVNHSTRVLSSLLRVANGSGYVSAPAISFIGGGCGAIKSNEIQFSPISGITIDTNNVPNAVGLYHYGGWYADWSEIEVLPTTLHASAIGIVIDSHTLGVPGPTGSYGGVYVSKYSNIYSDRVYVIGHDTSTATTLQWDTLDVKNFWAVGSRDITFVNPVIQGSSGYMLDLLNIDNVLLLGGDIESTATVIRARGSVNNVRSFGTRKDAASGPLLYGPFGLGWDFDFADSTGTDEVLRTGSAGSAGHAYQNTGWNVKHRTSVQYAGDVLVLSSNIKLTSATTGNLDDITNGGFAVLLNASGQLLLKSASSGANPRTLVDVAIFDAGGLMISTLPNVNPGAGTKKLWYDPSDSNRVKFAP